MRGVGDLGAVVTLGAELDRAGEPFPAGPVDRLHSKRPARARLPAGWDDLGGEHPGGLDRGWNRHGRPLDHQRVERLLEEILDVFFAVGTQGDDAVGQHRDG